MPIIKRITNYCNYATWNCDASEEIAPPKSSISNYGDTIWNIYVSEGFTPPVFANRFISATCVLNGRKAYSCVMRMGKKINI